MFHFSTYNKTKIDMIFIRFTHTIKVKKDVYNYISIVGLGYLDIFGKPLNSDVHFS